MLNFSFLITPILGWTIVSSLLWFALSLLIKTSKYFLSLCGVSHALGLLFFALCKGITITKILAFLCILISLTSFLYFCICAYVDISACLLQRKKRRKEQAKQRLFTLPDKENSFVQERLQTALHIRKKDEVMLSAEQLHLEYMRKILTRLKSAKLTPSDRLAVENYSRLITCYMSSGQLSVEETQGLNECFGNILKLCGKYAV